MKKVILFAVVISALLINACGGGGSDGSSALYPPALPTDLAVLECTESDVTIQWTDNADNESGYDIERSVNGGEYAPVAQTGADETVFSEGLADNTIYTYRVRAYNSAGDSEYSNEAGIKRPRSAISEISAAAGGIIEMAGLAKVTFPAESLADNVTVTAVEGVKDESVPADKRPYLDIVSDIKPLCIADFTAPDAELKKSVTLVMNYDPALLVTINDAVQAKNAELLSSGVVTQADIDNMKISENDLDIYYFNSINGKWVKTGAVIDTTNKTFTISAPYLGVYCVGYSMAEKTGVSLESNPDMQQQMVDMINDPEKYGLDDGEGTSKSGGSCESCKSSYSRPVSKVNLDPAPDSYRDSCTRTTPLIINGVEHDTIPGTDKPARCDNCSTYGGYLADKLSGFAFKGACANHDGCYRYGFTTYGYIKEICDLALYVQSLRSCVKKYPLLECGHISIPLIGRIKICWPAPWNAVMLVNCGFWATTVYDAVGLAGAGISYFAIVPYWQQPCLDYYRDGVDCHKPILRSIDSVTRSCEPAESIGFTSSIYNPDSRTITYEWSSSAGTFNNASTVDTTWTAPSAVDDDLDVTITLTILFGSGESKTKTRTVKVYKPYTITYDANTADSGTVPDQQTHIYYGTAVRLAVNSGILVKAECNFGGWNTSADASGFDRPAGSFYIMGKSDVTLFAKWTMYPVVYNGNVNTGGSVPVDTYNYQVGDTVTVSGPGDMVRDNYTFGFWNTAYDGSGTSYFPGNTFNFGSDITLYANWLWTRLIPTTGGGILGSVAVDSERNIYVVTGSTSSVDGEVFTGYRDVVLVKFNYMGIRQWTRLLGAPGTSVDTIPSKVMVDSADNIYITGYTEGSLPGNIVTGKKDMFLAKYDSDGNILWIKQLGVSGDDTRATCMVLDSSGNCYISGYTWGDLDGNPSIGKYDLFITKFNNNGEKQWTKLYGQNDKYTYPYDVAMDHNGYIYVTGYVDGDNPEDAIEMFIVKYDSEGNRLWTRLSGTNGGTTYGFDIDFDSMGNMYVMGYSSDLFIAKYDISGNQQWLRITGSGTSAIVPGGFKLDSEGNCYVTSHASISFNDQTLTGTYDTFAMKYDTNGNLLFTKLLGVSGCSTIAMDITIDLYGYIIVTGITTGNLDGQIKTGTVGSDANAFVTTIFNK